MQYIVILALVAVSAAQYYQNQQPQVPAPNNQPMRFSQYNTGYNSGYNSGYNQQYPSTNSQYGYNSQGQQYTTQRQNSAYTTTPSYYGTNRQFDPYSGVSSTTALIAAATTLVVMAL